MNVLALLVTTTFIAMAFSVQAQLNSTCNSNDLTVLKNFINGMESAIDGWSSDSSNCCNWTGVTCDFYGNVIELELSRKKLVGNLYDSFTFTGLNQLRTLNLSHNLLEGTLPISVFHFPQLQVLDLSSNEFTGSFPVSVNLPSIELLDVSDNNFEGPIAPGLCVNSTKLRVLKLGVNYFTGEIPPEFENCRSLEHLSLDANFVSGIIPDYLFRLPRLSRFSLQDNLLIGPIQIHNHSNLVYFDISLNLFSGNLPDLFSNFPRLTYFAAHSNNFSGRIPDSLLNSPTISSIILRNNSLNGLINLNCSAMINLILLDLASNNFLGSIPDNLPSCSRLNTIDLGENNLTGQIPETFKRFDSLSHLSLSMNNLQKLEISLEILQNCANLTTLVLNQSFKRENMPSNANLEFKLLETLAIPNCKLTGMIPVWLNGLTKLKILDLSWNELSGQIPPALGDLPSLFYLDISNNFLTGEIPKRLTRLPALRFHNLSLEVSLDFPILMRKSVTRKVLEYSYGIRFRPTLDLSNNFLTGPIWPEIGNLRNIHVLNLKYNELSGNIPFSLANLSCIESIDLSHNDLSGDIPSCLVKLSYLSRFSVAYNNLTGMIPSGGQFSTFSISSFEGNPGLCGEFVLNCAKVEDLLQNQEVTKTIDSIKMPVWIGFGTGFVLAVVLLLVLPAIRDTQRTTKFQLSFLRLCLIPCKFL